MLHVPSPGGVGARFGWLEPLVFGVFGSERKHGDASCDRVAVHDQCYQCERESGLAKETVKRGCHQPAREMESQPSGMWVCVKIFDEILWILSRFHRISSN